MATCYYQFSSMFTWIYILLSIWTWKQSPTEFGKQKHVRVCVLSFRKSLAHLGIFRPIHIFTEPLNQHLLCGLSWRHRGIHAGVNETHSCPLEFTQLWNPLEHPEAIIRNHIGQHLSFFDTDWNQVSFKSQTLFHWFK